MFSTPLRRDITRGATSCPFPEDFVRRFREAKARYDLRMTSVLIGEEPFALGEISDTVHRLDEALQAGEALAAHFASAFLERGHEPLHATSAPLRPGRWTERRARR